MLTPTPATGGLTAAPRIAGRAPYVSPQPPYEIDLWLNSNEGLAPPAELFADLSDAGPELARRYPSVAELETLLAEQTGQSRERLLVTAGGDDAIYRACLTMLDRGREIILPTPTFEMIERYARLAGGEIVEVNWLEGGYPIDAVTAAITTRTSLIAVVSPNNPTGQTARADDLHWLSAAAPRALLLVDLAYTEFADADLTQIASELPNALVIRTLSKGWGLAGLRVGYALGAPAVIRWLRTVGNPYAVSGLSAALAARRLRGADHALKVFVARVRTERAALSDVLREIGATPLPSQANFVLARFADAAATWDSLARCGIAVRTFPEHPHLVDYLRITCPGERAAFARLVAALRRA